MQTYCPMKSNCSVEIYVKQNLTKCQRSLCAQSRPGALLIRQIYWFPEEERFCLLWDSLQVRLKTQQILLSYI